MTEKQENEMEQIRKGLENFLDQEVEDIRKEERLDEEAEEIEDAADGEAVRYEEEWEESPEEDGRGIWDTGDEEKAESGEEAGRIGRAGRNAAGHNNGRKGTASQMRNGNDGRRAGKAKEGKMGKSGKKKHSGLKKLIIFIFILLILFFGGLYLAVGAVYDRMNYVQSESVNGPLKKDGVTSVLLIGSDSRTSGTEGRSDAMILITISDRTRSVHMTSLLRDMYVEIPGHDGNRLNAAYAYGGPELLMETINQNLGTEVYHYAVVNFEAFANLVDAVGGVELELTNEEVQWVNAYLNEYNELRGMPMETDYLDTSLSGNIHLNGAQALAYCRNRYIGTDFARTQRQRNVLSAVMKKLPGALITNPGGLINGLFPNLTTNLTQGECMRLAMMAGKLLTYDIVQDSLPLDGTYSNATIREMSVLQVDFDQNKAYIRKEIYGEE